MKHTFNILTADYMYMYFTKLLKKNNIKNYKGMAISFF